MELQRWILALFLTLFVLTGCQTVPLERGPDEPCEIIGSEYSITIAGFPKIKTLQPAINRSRVALFLKDENGYTVAFLLRKPQQKESGQKAGSQFIYTLSYPDHVVKLTPSPSEFQGEAFMGEQYVVSASWGKKTGFMLNDSKQMNERRAIDLAVMRHAWNFARLLDVVAACVDINGGEEKRIAKSIGNIIITTGTGCYNPNDPLCVDWVDWMDDGVFSQDDGSFNDPPGRGWSPDWDISSDTGGASGGLCAGATKPSCDDGKAPMDGQGLAQST